MPHVSRRALGIALIFGLLSALPATARQSRDRWVGTWATAPVGRPQEPPAAVPPAPAPAPFVHFENQTLRQIVHVSIGGSRVRVVLSNTFGTAPLQIGAAAIGVRDNESAARAGSTRALTFDGKPSTTIPAGALWFSDPVDVTVAPSADISVDLFLPATTNTPSPVSMHGAAWQTNYVSQTGNHAGAANFPVARTVSNWFFLARVEVTAPESVGAIVPYGDSITDGSRSTPDTNNRYPDHLSRRLIAANMRMAVLNAGIGGNRVLSDAAFGSGVNMVARFTRDVLDQAGIRYVIVLEGINDIGAARDNPSPTAADLIGAHKQLIERAHARGVMAFGATLTPYEGANYFSPVGEAKRQALNQWIRTSGAYDGVVDFDKATRDPAAPGKFLPAYDSGDHLHPNDAGYTAMAESIDLKLFRKK